MLKKLILFFLAITLALVAYNFFYGTLFTKRLSPQETVVYSKNNLELEVFYNRPSKKGRDIFGALVPYNKIWRTGANEATTFTTNQDLYILGQKLPANTYTLWTKPNETNWTVIFNSNQYPWGLDEQMKPMRDSLFDVVSVDVPILKIDPIVEKFTIAFENSSNKVQLTMAWDNVKIAVPLN